MHDSYIGGISAVKIFFLATSTRFWIFIIYRLLKSSYYVEYEYLKYFPDTLLLFNPKTMKGISQGPSKYYEMYNHFSVNLFRRITSERK